MEQRPRCPACPSHHELMGPWSHDLAPIWPDIRPMLVWPMLVTAFVVGAVVAFLLA